MTEPRLDFSNLHPGLSIDCVIFGFHDNQLKVLISKFKGVDKHALPGGFIQKEEDVDEAAVHVLRDRTGLDHIFLTQFHLFGEVSRLDLKHNEEILKIPNLPENGRQWLNQRFATVGYYALVEHSKVVPVPDAISDYVRWFGLNEIPRLILDHTRIVNRALWTLRTQLKFHPIGINLLPEQFTMPELQALYETLLDKKLDRRNFQRKMLGYDILTRHNERRAGGAHKAPYLYSFDKEKYQRALNEGLNSTW